MASEKVKIVINTSYGGFGLSAKAQQKYDAICNKNRSFPIRTDPRLVEIVETMGEESFGNFATLVIVEIPEEFKDCYQISEYDGKEEIDLSPELLISHELQNLSVDDMTPEDCKLTLLRFKEILATNFYDMLS